MDLFWVAKKTGNILGPWATMSRALDHLDRGDGDKLLSTTAIDWTPQLRKEQG